MIEDVKTVLMRSSPSLVADAAGVAALGVLLVLGLCLPALI